jgi:2-oxoglutarate dehydrogenase E1 component
MYEKIRVHPTVRELYARRLEQQGVMTREETETLSNEVLAVLEQAKREADGYGPEQQPGHGHITNGHAQIMLTPSIPSAEQLQRWNSELLTWPQDFSLNPKLTRTLQRRASAFGPAGGIDWGHAEALAFASILADGTPVRLTGQDSERGTFSHRHAILHDQRDGFSYIPLQHLSDARASFSVYNSPLSETGVLGFEYGYSVHAPDTLVLWEAQFGDFANVAQVIIDQFLASGMAKWRQHCSLVLLLPHGYEGQGPDHSSARLERYLQLAAEGNWCVANCSTAAQYFRLLRRQAANLLEMPRPLIIMTPKSLLRHPASASKLEDLVETSFQTVLDDSRPQVRPEQVRRVLLCSGKIAIDLLAHESLKQNNEIALVRVEQLYPFPKEEIQRVLARYPKMRELFWVQEEPRNMGAWNYIAPRLSEVVQSHIKVEVVSRPERSSPAAGFWDLYEAEQEQIIAQASGLPLGQPGGRNVR